MAQSCGPGQFCLGCLEEGEHRTHKADGVKQDDPRPGQRDLVQACQRPVRLFDWRLDVLVPGDLGISDAPGLVQQDDGPVRLGEGQHQGDGGAAEPEQDVEAPAPVIFGELQEARDDRAEGGADPNHAGEAGHGVAALDGVEEVGQHAGRVGEGRADEAARQETADQEGAEVGGEGAQEVEQDVGREGDVEDEAPPKVLRQRRGDERAAAVPQQKEGYGQTGGLNGDVEVL